MTDIDDLNQEKGKNDGGDEGRKEGDLDDKNIHFNLRKYIKYLKKEQSNQVKIKGITRVQQTDRIIGEMIQDTVENLNWEYSKIEGGKLVRPGRGWIVTGAIIIGIEYIYQEFDIKGIEAKFMDIMKKGDYHAKKEIKARYPSHGSFPLNNYLNESERGKISKLGELTGFDAPKVKGFLFSLGVVDEGTITERERTAYKFDAEGLTGQLPQRMNTIEGVWNKNIREN